MILVAEKAPPRESMDKLTSLKAQDCNIYYMSI